MTNSIVVGGWARGPDISQSVTNENDLRSNTIGHISNDPHKSQH